MIWNMVCFQSPFCVWKDYSLFYSSLFTKPPETPINTGLPSGEEWQGTLHHSSPYKRGAAYLCKGVLLSRYLSRSLVIIDDQRWSSMMAEAGSREWSRSHKKYRVKSGEEWWRVHSHSSPVQISYIQLVISYLWRVKSIFESSSLFIKRSQTPSENVKNWEKVLRKMWVFNIKLLCKMW